MSCRPAQFILCSLNFLHAGWVCRLLGSREWKCSSLIFKRQKYVANFHVFINICIYFYSLQKYQKYQLPSHFSAPLWDLHVCLCGSLAHARKHCNVCLQIRWSPILSSNKSGSKSMVQILYLAIASTEVNCKLANPTERFTGLNRHTVVSWLPDPNCEI